MNDLNRFENTEAKTGHRFFSCKLYDTIICTCDLIGNRMKVNHGGFKTRTTTKRLNECFEHLGVPFHAFMKVGEIYIKNTETFHTEWLHKTLKLEL